MTEQKEYPKPSLTADVVAVALAEDGRLRVLLIQRGREPFRGAWAVPGGFCEPGESVEQSAARELEEETKLKGLRLTQLHTFSEPGRDPRGWVVSVAHLGFVPLHRLGDAGGGDDADDARWWAIEHREGATPPFRLVDDKGAEAGKLAFDHDAILTKAIERLRHDVDELAPELVADRANKSDLERARRAILGGSGDGAKNVEKA